MTRAVWTWIFFGVVVLLAVFFVAVTGLHARANLDLAAGGILLILLAALLAIKPTWTRAVLVALGWVLVIVGVWLLGRGR